MPFLFFLFFIAIKGLFTPSSVLVLEWIKPDTHTHVCLIAFLPLKSQEIEQTLRIHAESQDRRLHLNLSRMLVASKSREVELGACSCHKGNDFIVLGLLNLWARALMLQFCITKFSSCVCMGKFSCFFHKTVNLINLLLPKMEIGWGTS